MKHTTQHDDHTDLGGVWDMEMMDDWTKSVKGWDWPHQLMTTKKIKNSHKMSNSKFYNLLGVSKDASSSQIKKGYRNIVALDILDFNYPDVAAKIEFINIDINTKSILVLI